MFQQTDVSEVICVCIIISLVMIFCHSLNNTGPPCGWYLMTETSNLVAPPPPPPPPHTHTHMYTHTPPLSAHQTCKCGTLAIISRCSEYAYYRNSNAKGVVDSTTAHAQKYDVSTHTVLSYMQLISLANHKLISQVGRLIPYSLDAYIHFN